MARIQRTVVASGIIGQYGHEWVIMRLYDMKNNSECYDLYINKNYYDSYPSTFEALDMLVDQFRE